jgi:hypothetical protein
MYTKLVGKQAMLFLPGDKIIQHFPFSHWHALHDIVFIKLVIFTHIYC